MQGLKNSSRILISAVMLVSFSSSFAQFSLKKQIPEKVTFEAVDVIDSTYGIIIYEELNMQLRGDSVRMCGNYACQQWVEDFYTTGELLHKGFYIDGQLSTYKNYYPNGNLEREFKSIDNYRSIAKLYYPNGQLKSEIRYNDGGTELWIDYSENGQVLYKEQMDKGMNHLVVKNYYFLTGTPRIIMELKDKKKLTYTYTEYDDAGKLKIQGQKIYDNNRFDYVSHGTWKYFNASGSLEKEEEFDKGEKTK